MNAASRREIEPEIRFGVVLRDALALAVHRAQAKLCIGIALVGSLAEPDGRLWIVSRYALA